MKRIVLTLLLAPCAALAIDTAVFDDPAKEARYRELIGELRCLVCQNQTLADSTAPLAVDLRDQVRAQVAAGRSDEQIVAWLTARYGDFVLYRPRLAWSTALLWAAPLLLLLAGVLLAWRMLAHPARAAVPVDERARARVRALLDRGGGR